MLISSTSTDFLCFNPAQNCPDNFKVTNMNKNDEYLVMNPGVGVMRICVEESIGCGIDVQFTELLDAITLIDQIPHDYLKEISKLIVETPIIEDDRTTKMKEMVEKKLSLLKNCSMIFIYCWNEKKLISIRG